MFFLSKIIYLYEWEKEKKSCGYVRLSVRDQKGWVEVHLNQKATGVGNTFFWMKNENHGEVLIIENCKIETKTSFILNKELDFHELICNVIIDEKCYTDEHRRNLFIRKKIEKENTQEKEKLEKKHEIAKKPSIHKYIDLNQLPKIWNKYRRNRFFIHGYKNYKHFYAGEKIIGLPGNYYDREHQLAKLFGFLIFIKGENFEKLIQNESLFDQVEKVITSGKNNAEEKIIILADMATSKLLEGEFGYYIGL